MAPAQRPASRIAAGKPPTCTGCCCGRAACDRRAQRELRAEAVEEGPPEPLFFDLTCRCPSRSRFFHASLGETPGWPPGWRDQGGPVLVRSVAEVDEMIWQAGARRVRLLPREAGYTRTGSHGIGCTTGEGPSGTRPTCRGALAAAHFPGR